MKWYVILFVYAHIVGSNVCDKYFPKVILSTFILTYYF